jgi:uncharacterized protein YjbI with pentapeptide repeats
MANQEQLEILKEGYVVWNKWREENSNIKIDLSDANLVQADLALVNLSEANLSNASLNKADLRTANLSSSDLSHSNLCEANLDNADLGKTNLLLADLRKANLKGAYLTEAHFYGANFTEACLIGAHLSEANLRDANFSKVNLNEADLHEAMLWGVNLNGAILGKANLTGAKLSNASLDEADLREAALLGADLKEARLHRADLTKANLSRAHLIETDLIEAKLSEAKLVDANLMGANLDRADLREVNLSGANLSRTHLIGSNFLKAKVGGTIFGNSDLSQTIGLGDVLHLGPSSISTDIFALSRGEISAVFLKGCGLSDWEIESVKLYNPDLSNEEKNSILYKMYELIAGQALQISPLFISYSRSDSTFVDKIESQLNKRGIRFWRDVHDMKAGRMEKQIDRAMRLNPTVLLILSGHSLQSDWVEHEVRTARALEKEMKRDVLCPVALDDSWKNSPWAKRIMEQIMEYNILNFSEWKDDTKFESTFNKLIDGLELFYK